MTGPALAEFGLALHQDAAAIHAAVLRDVPLLAPPPAWPPLADAPTDAAPMPRLTLQAARAALLAGALSAEHLVRSSLAALAGLDPQLNCATALDPAVLDQAARNNDGPLAGIPLAHKDMFDRAGHRASFGGRLGQAEPARHTAEPLARLEAAGALTIGALAMSEFALGPTGHNATFGHCRNPWNPDRISGGSSSGPAAAVAAGIVFGALGSDTGGSIRIPAACCGVVGFKPGWGVVPMAGAMPLSPSLDCLGPLARSVADCALLYGLIAGIGPAVPPPAPAIIAVPRVDDHVTPEIAAALETAARCLRDAGCSLAPAALPDIPQLHALADAVQKPESAAAHLERLRAARHLYTPGVRRRIEAGLLVSAALYARALGERPARIAAFCAGILGDAEALLLPALGFAVPRIDATDEAAQGAAPALVARMTHWTRWVNYLGLPALVVPIGLDSQGLPLAAQLVGRPGGEVRLLALGQLLECLVPQALPRVHCHATPIAS